MMQNPLAGVGLGELPKLVASNGPVQSVDLGYGSPVVSNPLRGIQRGTSGKKLAEKIRVLDARGELVDSAGRRLIVTPEDLALVEAGLDVLGNRLPKGADAAMALLTSQMPTEATGLHFTFRKHPGWYDASDTAARYRIPNAVTKSARRHLYHGAQLITQALAPGRCAEVTSAYRGPALNRRLIKLYGPRTVSSKSFHLSGRAIDLKACGDTTLEQIEGDLRAFWEQNPGAFREILGRAWYEKRRGAATHVHVGGFDADGPQTTAIPLAQLPTRNFTTSGVAVTRAATTRQASLPVRPASFGSVQRKQAERQLGARPAAYRQSEAHWAAPGRGSSPGLPRDYRAGAESEALVSTLVLAAEELGIEVKFTSACEGMGPCNAVHVVPADRHSMQSFLQLARHLLPPNALDPTHSILASDGTLTLALETPREWDVAGWDPSASALAFSMFEFQSGEDGHDSSDTTQMLNHALELFMNAHYPPEGPNFLRKPPKSLTV